MRSKLWLPLVFMLGLCVVTMMELGVKIVREERAVLRTQYQRLYSQRLVEYRSQVSALLEEHARSAVERLRKSSLSAWQLRKISESSGSIETAFLLDDGGRFIAPAPKTQSPREKEFMLRTAGANFHSPGDSGRLETGWHTYYWSDGVHIVYLSRCAENFCGVEFEKIRLLSDIAGILPDDAKHSIAAPASLILLTDELGREVFRSTVPKHHQFFEPVVGLALEPPLAMLQLVYLVPEGMWDQAFYNSALITILPGLLFIISILLVLTLYFYREHTREVREAAQRVNFVNQVSHELKTPLTNIRMYAELLESHVEAEDERAHEHLGIIVSESHRLSRLITSILSFSLKEKGRLEVRPVRARVCDVVHEVLEHFNLYFEEEGMEVHLKNEDSTEALLDPDCLNQILGNLFSNVCKYAACGGCLRIESFRQGEHAYVRVADRGPGVPKESVEKIFEAFFRSSDALNEGASGTGIGLSISRDLAGLHGGSLELEESDSGASFLLKIYAPPADEKPQTIEKRCAVGGVQ